MRIETPGGSREIEICSVHRSHGPEEIDVSGHEFLHRHRRLAGHATDDVVCPGKNAVLIVLRHRAQVLNQEGRHHAGALETLAVGVDRNRLISDRSPDRLLMDLTLRREPLNFPPGGALLRREYALVYRAGLSNEVRPFKLRLWDKSYNFAHGILQIKNSEAHVALGHSN